MNTEEKPTDPKANSATLFGSVRTQTIRYVRSFYKTILCRIAWALCRLNAKFTKKHSAGGGLSRAKGEEKKEFCCLVRKYSEPLGAHNMERWDEIMANAKIEFYPSISDYNKAYPGQYEDHR